ncbi:Carbon-nitrogen hydrolase [Rubripirellula tenax]|uniref:Carbon-nitrogen hydrolase n=1 Tax=Rubripirellula tenax TaxID=2528015 RepID=A0A5C6F6J3_9BACT|nr:carbon-nitrogen hydrolase family protein [Rubripirellula tenax]TWU56988.1 Carbon-nitrogen hydrolase [Rubripirellula tenax]
MDRRTADAGETAMTNVRIALANVRSPATPEASIEIVLDAMLNASAGNASVVCFPECILPGYRAGTTGTVPETGWLENAWSIVDRKAAELNLCVILGTERRVVDDALITARVTHSDGSHGGFQDKVQLDPSEENEYAAGVGRRLFQCGPLTFGIVICHEGWRYPETVRWAARHGAHVVFHPHFEIVSDPNFRPRQFADPASTFHEKAALCRAAENTCYFATVNCALRGAVTTSAIVDPEGELMVHQPYGEEGILFGEVETERATGFLAGRLKGQA